MGNIGKKLKQATRELLEMRGDHVGMGTEFCVAYEANHANCQGCGYELGCCKLVKILLASFANNDIDAILDAKTVEEIKALKINRSDKSPV